MPPDPDERAGRPSVCETHVSVLIFYDDVVMKLKKPVRFPFVDFRALEDRRSACEEEVRVNRRLAPDVYLGVAQTRLGDRVLDYGVVMRRLPDDRSLAAMVADGDPRVAQGLRSLATSLATFHAASERSPEIDRGGDVDTVRDLWDASIRSLRSGATGGVEDRKLAEVDRLAQRFLRGRGALFAERVALGRVCDGHGDLQASDVFLLDDGPRVLDAVEFDRRLRHADVIADAAFLAMDLERLGAPEDAASFLADYQSAAGEVFPPPLLHYYCAARALVRAMVAGLRGRQRVETGDRPGGQTVPDEITQSTALVDLALAHLRVGRVVLGVVSGLPATGKSTLAAAAGDVLRWPVLRSDEVRRELVGAPPGAPLVAGLGLGAYGAEVTERTYTTMLERAQVSLEHGQSVILDATFTDRRWQGAAEALAEASGADLAVVEAVAPLEVAADRARARLGGGWDVSGADEGVVRDLAARAHLWPGARAVNTGASDPQVAAAEVVAVLCAGPAAPS